MCDHDAGERYLAERKDSFHAVLLEVFERLHLWSFRQPVSRITRSLYFLKSHFTINRKTSCSLLTLIAKPRGVSVSVASIFSNAL